jgi:GDPmannose 4,6-dehydratase
MAQKALVTGVAGQDGSYLAEWLISQGYEVSGMVRRSSSSGLSNLAAIRDRIELVEGDLLDHASLRAAVETAAPNELYHLAAPTFVPDSWDAPSATFAAIADATQTLLEAARASDPALRVYVATSSEIFGDAGESPQREDSPKRPLTPYGEAKLAAHERVGEARAAGMHACAGITYNHESPRRPARFLPRKVTRGAAAIKLGQAGELVLGDLDAVRDWCHAADVARAAWLALQHDEPADYVIASGVGRSVRDLVAAAFGHLDLDSEEYVRVDERFQRPPEATAKVGDPSRARELLGWAPEISFEAMIAEMVDADLEALRVP